MAFIPVPLTAEFELVYTLDGETIENTLYMRRNTAWTPSLLNTVAQALSNWWEGNIAPSLGAALSLVRIECTDLASSSGPSATFVFDLPKFGILGQPCVSLNVAPAIKFKTASRGRSFTGRNYIPGLTEPNVDASRVLAPVMDALAAGYNELIGAAGDAGVEWVVASRYSGVDPVTKKPIPRTTGIATPIISATFTDNVVDSQRRRLPNR